MKLNMPSKTPPPKNIASIGENHKKNVHSNSADTINLSYKLYHQLFDYFKIPLCILNADTTIAYINPVLSKMSGFSKEEMEGHSFYLFIPQDDSERLRRFHDLRRSNPGSVPDSYELAIKSKDKRTEYKLVHVSLIPGTQLSIVTFTDITKQKEMEMKLKKKNEQYNSIINTSLDAIIEVNMTFEITMANKIAWQSLGLKSESDLIGTSVFKYIVLKQRAKAEKTIKDLLKIGYYRSLEFEVLIKGGKVVPVEANLSVIYDDNNHPKNILAFIRNIEERKRMERELFNYNYKLETMVMEKVDQLRKQERVATIGRLAKSIGHNIANPLHYIRGNAELLKNMLDKSELDIQSVKDFTDAIIDGCDKIKEITDQLRRASREDNVTTFDIIDPIRTAITITKGSWKNKCSEIKLVNNLKGEVRVKGIFSDLSHVFMNLIINSTQAIDGKGKIEIELSEIENEQKVVIKVKDDGVGIPEDVARKIGREAITTKEPEEGTGLGLLWVYEIVKQHFGTINFESEKDKGTTFTIILPVQNRVS